MKARTRHNSETEKLELWDERTQGWQTVVAGQVVREGGRVSKLVESFESLGLSRQEAVMAAGVERGVRQKDLNKVFNAALALGLTEAEANIFADADRTRPSDLPFGLTEETLPQLKDGK